MSVLSLPFADAALPLLDPKVVSILYVGGAVGALIGGSLCDRFGRKRTIIFTDIVFIVGALVL